MKENKELRKEASSYRIQAERALTQLAKLNTSTPKTENGPRASHTSTGSVISVDAENIGPADSNSVSTTKGSSTPTSKRAFGTDLGKRSLGDLLPLSRDNVRLGSADSGMSKSPLSKSSKSSNCSNSTPVTGADDIPLQKSQVLAQAQAQAQGQQQQQESVRRTRVKAKAAVVAGEGTEDGAGECVQS
jgi:hypothetical protein